MEYNHEMITQSTVLEMGWTKTLIKRLLPAPVEKKNRMYPHSAPYKLYEKTVVLATMETDAFKEAMAKVEKRRESACLAVATKTKHLTDEIMEGVRSFDIQVIPDDELRARTLQAKRDWYIDHEQYENIYVEDADEATIQRWVVNYIRHELVIFYDRNLGCLEGKVGKYDAYETYKTEILRMIAEKYPKYANECDRQIERAYYGNYRNLGTF